MLTQGRRIGWRGAIIFPEDYFGPADSGVSVALAGVQADALAGAVAAAGMASATLPAVQAQSDAGSLSADGDGSAGIGGASAIAQAGELGAFTPSTAVAGIAGVEATATAGAVSAAIRAPSQSGGGRPHFQHGRMPQPAAVYASVRGAGVNAKAGTVTARQGNKARVFGAFARISPGAVTGAGSAHVRIAASPIVGAAGKSEAVGTWPLTDQEIIFALLDQAA